MEQFRDEGFVDGDTLAFNPIGGGILLLEGEVACKGTIVIQVFKSLEILPNQGDCADPLVQSIRYSYNAFVQGVGNIMRNDNAHSHLGHGDAHHRHVFDWKTKTEKPGSPFWIGEDKWPTLGDFIADARDWYWENHADLPDSFPELGRSYRSSPRN